MSRPEAITKTFATSLPDGSQGRREQLENLNQKAKSQQGLFEVRTETVL